MTRSGHLDWASPPTTDAARQARVFRTSGIIAGVSLLLRAGDWDRVTPASAGWRYLSFHVTQVAGVQEHATGAAETALVLLEGACAVEADGERFELGPRAGVFEQLPW